jgi:hypothetical protein
LPEKLYILGIGTRPTAFNEGNSQLIESTGNA